MPPQGKDERMTTSDLMETFASGLKRFGAHPNMVAYKPHYKQEIFHKSCDRIKLFLGGNRSGKTTAGVIEVLWWATDTHPYREIPLGPLRIRIVGSDFPNGIDKIIIPEIQRWVKASELRGESWGKAYSAKERRLYFKTGSFIEFMSADSALDKHAGTSRHLILFDEEPPEDIYKENRARTIDTAGTIMFTMTPLLGLTWIYEDIYKKSDVDGITVVEVAMDENPFLSEVEVAAFALGLSKEDKEARIKGRFQAIGGLIFKDFDTEKHVVEPYVPPKEWEWYMSLDHGINNPTSVHWHAVSPTGRIVTFAEHYASDMTLEQHATAIHSKEAMFGRIPDYRVIDPATNQRNAVTGDSLIVEYSLLGLHFIPGNNKVELGLAKMKEMLKPNADGVPAWQFTSDCTQAIREFQRYRYASFESSKTAGRNNRKETPVKKDDHAMDDLRYFATLLPDLSPSFQPEAKKVEHDPNERYDEMMLRSLQNAKPQEDYDYEYG